MTIEELEDEVMRLRMSLEEMRNLSRVSLEVLDLLLTRFDVLAQADAITLTKELDALTGKPDWKRIDRDSEPVRWILRLRNALITQHRINTSDSPSTDRDNVVSLSDRDKPQ